MPESLSLVFVCTLLFILFGCIAFFFSVLSSKTFILPSRRQFLSFLLLCCLVVEFVFVCFLSCFNKFKCISLLDSMSDCGQLSDGTWVSIYSFSEPGITLLLSW